MRLTILSLIAAVFITLAWIAAFWPAYSHGHSFYDPACCSDRDCGPLPDGIVTGTKDGWHIATNNMTLPYNSPKVRNSPDGKFHGCFLNGNPKTALICLYVPGMGS